MKNLVIVATLAAFVAGCAGPNPSDIKPIQAVYADRLAEIKLGISTSEFRQKFPEAHPAGQSGSTTAYEITLKQVLHDRRRPVDAQLGLYQPKDIISDQSLWFYFYSDQLVQWGRPQDWPQKPDVIIESRTR